MAQNILKMSKTIFLLATVGSLFFTACGENPIEAENDKQLGFSKAEVAAAIDSLEAERGNVTLYNCLQSNKAIADKDRRELRCKNFIEKYQESTKLASIFNMVADTANYNDKGIYVGAKYIVVNKLLNITLTKYEQSVDSFKSDKEVADPEIRFFVKTFIDGEESGYEQLSSPIAFDASKTKKWDGSKAITVQVPRGIDALEICPVVRDITETETGFDYTDLIVDNCIKVKDIGYIEDKTVSAEKNSSKTAKIEWNWFLYETKN